MDREGFSQMLRGRRLTEEQIASSIAIAERFETYLVVSNEMDEMTAAWKFCRELIREGQDTFDNLLALARYGRFIKNNLIYIAFIEVIDGAEAQPNLFEKVGTLFGKKVRDEVFAGIGASPLGLPPTDKPFDMFPVIDRLVGKLGYTQTEQLLAGSLRDLPDEYYLDEVEKYRAAKDIDQYLRQKHQRLVDQLDHCREEGELFFSQEISEDVVEYVRNHPETECGVRDGNILYITKIPYNAKQYLAEADTVMKRFYACHCPWARQAIKNGSIRMNPVFCYCSGGFSKKPWEVIFGQSLKVDLLESALKGDLRCRFAVHLPDQLDNTMAG